MDRREYLKQWRRDNPDKWREYHYRSKYGLTLEQARQFLDGNCEICKSVKAVHIDHDHITGRVRGGLCDNCNIGLGRFKDSVELLKEAIEYLVP